MKRFGKLLFVVVVCCLLFTGCKNSKDDNTKVTNDSISSFLVSEFENQIKSEKDIEKVANAISTNKKIEISVGVVEATEGFLDGFEGEIKGFTKGYAIKPMISTQPFVAYVFETDNTSALKKTLEDSANKRWNICTEADDFEITAVDKYVFVVMAPTSFEE